MAGPESLKEVYADELKELWSANDQVVKVVKVRAKKLTTPISRRCLGDQFQGSRVTPLL
jgi:hypothetical protein